jgi:Gluconate 2-dehydrogenase subunit 3
MAERNAGRYVGRDAGTDAGRATPYRGYDVQSKRWTPSWNEKTRRVIDQRMAVAREPRFFSVEEWRTLSALCDRILPQPATRPPVPLPAYVDEKLYTHQLDGYRYAQLPEQGEAWRRGLAALEAEARSSHGRSFRELTADQQDALIARMQRGELHGAAFRDMPCRLFFERRVIPDITHAYYAHPTAWNEIGYGGPASPRGYVRMGLDRRDPWEAPSPAARGAGAGARAGAGTGAGAGAGAGAGGGEAEDDHGVEDAAADARRR